MALRQSATTLSKCISRSTSTASPLLLPKKSATQAARCLATVHTPPVTQNSAGSKGPTAMVFLNMGGPSTVDEVGGFLSRLFVRGTRGADDLVTAGHCPFLTNRRTMTGRRRPHPPWALPKLPRPPNLQTAHAQDSEAIRGHRRRLANPEVVGTPERRDVQDPRQPLPGDGAAQALRRLPLRESPDRGDVQPAVRRRVRPGPWWSRRRLHSVPAVLVLDDRVVDERAVEVAPAPGKGGYQGADTMECN